MSIIAEWLRQGRRVKYGYVKKITSTVLPANSMGENTPLLDLEREGVLMAGVVGFDSPLCGVRAILDDGDTEDHLRCDRMFALGMYLYPQEFFYLSVYNTVLNVYVIMATHERYFARKAILQPFNNDVAAHSMIGYGVLYNYSE